MTDREKLIEELWLLVLRKPVIDGKADVNDIADFILDRERKAKKKSKSLA